MQRKVNLLTAVFAAALCLMLGVLVTALFARSYLRAVAPAQAGRQNRAAAARPASPDMPRERGSSRRVTPVTSTPRSPSTPRTYREDEDEHDKDEDEDKGEKRKKRKGKQKRKHKRRAAIPDQEAQQIYAELRRRGVFAEDPDAATIAQELIRRGVLRDL